MTESVNFIIVFFIKRKRTIDVTIKIIYVLNKFKKEIKKRKNIIFSFQRLIFV